MFLKEGGTNLNRKWAGFVLYLNSAGPLPGPWARMKFKAPSILGLGSFSTWGSRATVIAKGADRVLA